MAWNFGLLTSWNRFIPPPVSVPADAPSHAGQALRSRSQDGRQGTEPAPPQTSARPLPVPAGSSRRPGPGLTPPQTSARAQVAAVPVGWQVSRRRRPLRHPRRLPARSFVCMSADPLNRHQLFPGLFTELFDAPVSAGRPGCIGSRFLLPARWSTGWNRRAGKLTKTSPRGNERRRAPATFTYGRLAQAGRRARKRQARNVESKESSR